MVTYGISMFNVGLASGHLMEYDVGLRVDRDREYFQFFVVSKTVLTELDRDEKVSLVVGAVDVVAEVLRQGVQPLENPTAAINYVLDEGRPITYVDADRVRTVFDTHDVNEKWVAGPLLYTISVESPEQA